MLREYLELLDKGKLEAAEAVRLKSIPDYLYKFYPLSSFGYGQNDLRTFRTLSSGSIWLSSLQKYNDPFEGIGMYFDSNKLKEMGISLEIVQEMEDKFTSQLATSSFTTELNNIAMWAYYANDHKGFCIRYRIINKKVFYKMHYLEKRIPLYQILLKAIS